VAARCDALDRLDAEVIVAEGDGLRNSAQLLKSSAVDDDLLQRGDSPPSSQPAAWLMRWLWLRTAA